MYMRSYGETEEHMHDQPTGDLCQILEFERHARRAILAQYDAPRPACVNSSHLNQKDMIFFNWSCLCNELSVLWGSWPVIAVLCCAVLRGFCCSVDISTAKQGVKTDGVGVEMWIERGAQGKHRTPNVRYSVTYVA
jgi:hypothetical protein